MIHVYPKSYHHLATLTLVIKVNDPPRNSPVVDSIGEKNNQMDLDFMSTVILQLYNKTFLRARVFADIVLDRGNRQVLL